MPTESSPPAVVPIALASSGAGASSNPAMVSHRITLPRLASVAAVVATLYIARDVFLPLSIAMLITFALAPLATRLRVMGLPNLLSVLVVVAVAAILISLFLLVAASQLSSLAQNLPTFQANIIAKVEALREAGSSNGIVGRLGRMITEITAEIGAANPVAASGDLATTPPPLPVEVVDSKSSVALLQDLVLPLISPIATVGLVIVIVIFMLLERNDLRDRFIKLVGSNDIHRTTQVLREAGDRVTQYLLVQLLVNMIYAIPIALGLYLIGVPNAILWGLLTLVLRFVPYIGSVLAAAFPLFLAFAIARDCSAVLWTIALFATVELITSNVIEPYLYGSRTGVSPLAIIISAVIWTWLWGPLGLVLSTPLTVCLVVLGRHIPQFEVFFILFGDESVLAPHARLYQRLLVGDTIEATVRAQEALETVYLDEYYRDVGIPALLIAQQDHARGVLTAEQRSALAQGAHQMVNDLAAIAEAERLMPDDPGDAEEPGPPGQTGAGFSVLCLGGRSDLDDVAAAMLSQTLSSDGADAIYHPHTDLSPQRLTPLIKPQTDCVILGFLDPAPSRASFLHIRWIKQLAPKLRVGIVIWQHPDHPASPDLTAQSLQQAIDIGADFAVTSIDAATKSAFTAAPSIPVAKIKRRIPQRLSAPKTG